jgi:beta-glucosidase
MVVHEMTSSMKNTFNRSALGPDFLLGVATSSYQIEGAVNEDGRGPGIWDEFSHLPGTTKNGDTGDIACDHYHRMSADVRLLSWMGVDAYRFSIAWPRVIPNGVGAVNEKGLDFYDRLVDLLVAKGIKPCVTLYHWDLPAALEGAWLNRKTVDAFGEYTKVVAKRLGDRVAMWFTHNEPWCQAFLGYETGVFAPGHRDMKEALLCAHHLLLSHGVAVDELREHVRTPVGPALNFMPAHPFTDSRSDRDAAMRQDGYFNRWFVHPISGRGYPEDMLELYGALMPKFSVSDLDIIARPIDVLGVNYYERCIVSDSSEGVIKVKHEKRPNPHTADREIYPEGLAEILTRLHLDYGFKSLAVTENGAAFHETPDNTGYIDDHNRVDFLITHLEQAQKAIAFGVPLAAYFAWSLMDNFEWSEGYNMRYGLTHVDFATQQRTPKTSAHFLRSLSRKNRDQ